MNSMVDLPMVFCLPEGTQMWRCSDMFRPSAAFLATLGHWGVFQASSTCQVVPESSWHWEQLTREMGNGRNSHHLWPAGLLKHRFWRNYRLKYRWTCLVSLILFGVPVKFSLSTSPSDSTFPLLAFVFSCSIFQRFCRFSDSVNGDEKEL